MGKSITGRMLAAVLLFAPLIAHAAGLGKLTLLSALGQPLNAEIAVVSEQPDELDSLSARLASPDAFAKAGLEFNPVLLGMTVDIERRNGKAVLQLHTKQPVNEPFLDILIELQWSSGRLMREYTFLLDPPEYKGPQPIAAAPPPPPQQPVAPPAEQPIKQPMAKPAPQAVEERPIAATPEPAAPAAAAPPAPPAPPPPPKEPQKKQTYEVKKGDTLGEIALRYKSKGVTYNQMLIALFRANRKAFIHNNVNLVRAGRILNIPGYDDVSEVDPDEARAQVHEHMAEFAEYRRKLAAAAAAAKPAPEAAGQQTAAGQITEKPAEPAAEAKQDQLKLSKAEPGKPGSAASVAASEDNRIAQERALQEAQSRVTDLEKNVSDLQKLLTLRNEQIAELRKQAEAAKATPPAPQPAPPQPAAQPAPQPAEQPAAQAAPQPAPQSTAQALPPPTPPAESKPSQAAPAAQPAPPAAAHPAPKPQPKPRKRVIVPPPPPEPSLVDELLGNPMALGGIGVIVALLLGYGAWAWQRKKSGQKRFHEGVSGVEPGAVGASSVFSAPDQQPGGTPSEVSMSQASVGGMDADEVDPIAEADVYMAYGRDAQAEEILKEALQKDPNRTAVHAKLLEIFSGRRDTAAFEQTALKLKDLTHGAGPEWDKATVLGRAIDPENGLYGGGVGAVTEPAPIPTAAAAAAPAPQPAAPTIDFDLDSTQGTEASSSEIDFDLGTGTHETVQTEQSAFSAGGTLKMRMDREEAPASTGLDFDLGGGEESKAPDMGLDFELPSSTPAAEEATAPAPAADKAGAIDFDLNLDSEAPKDTEPSGVAPPVDLASISLDLGGATDTLAPATQTDPKWQEVATKLDLAKAYEDMGDKDGARELLNEVMKEGDAEQKGQAEQMLASLD